MPTEEDRERAEHQLNRWLILQETWDELLADWLSEHVDSERLEVWGPPDTSANPLVDIAAQLSTPGLYGRRPAPDNPDELGKALVGPEGFLDQVRYFSKMQRVQFYAIGLGDFLVRWSVNEKEKALRARLVPPHLIYARADPDDPGTPVELWELRPRLLEEIGKEPRWIWAWDQFRLEDPDEGGLPSYKVIAAESVRDDGIAGMDLSGSFLSTDANPSGRQVGETYPFEDENGAILPWTWYRSVDAGTLWAWTAKRGAFRGTLNTGLNWTYTQRAARDASGKTTIVIGAQAPPVQTKKGEKGTVRSIQLTPGAALFLKADPEATQLLVQDVGPGGNLTDLAAYSSGYELRQAVRWGLNPADVQRLNNNPMSGAALFVTSKGRREFSRQVEDLFRDSDLSAFRTAAALLRAVGLGAFPSGGYSIVYFQIPESPQEEQASRDQTDWDLEKGVIGPLDVVKGRRPGLTDEDALRVLVENEVQKRIVAQAVEEELERRKLSDDGGIPIDKVELAPTDLASIITVNEARAQEGLGTVDGGDLTITEFRERNAARAKAAAASSNTEDL